MLLPCLQMHQVGLVAGALFGLGLKLLDPALDRFEILKNEIAKLNSCPLVDCFFNIYRLLLLRQLDRLNLL